ncbi:MAG: CSLREA domain-containing protein, partial [Chloroflexales bacterium]|nr:CSLREA domain-containing protein [Chloroflexales bacterium]
MFYHSRWLHLFTAIVLVLTSFAVTAPPLTAQTGNVYTVTTTLDDEPGNCTMTPANCSLRQAIESANSDGGPSTIEFVLPTGPTIITPTSELPPLTDDGTTIDGSNSFTPANLPTIEINGAGTLAYGIQIESANNVIRGLIINNFNSTIAPNGVGIYITGSRAQNNRIWANYMGNRPRDTAKYSNQRGIQIGNGASGTIIGGSISNSQERNTISGNDLSGIYLTGATNTQIQGNYIGLALNANDVAVPLGNIGPGIEILDSSNSLVGGTATGQRNLISDNGDSPTRGAGILIRGVSTTGTQVLGNYIGTSSNGLSAIPNNGDGIRIQNGASNTVISSGNGLARSVISGNTGYGIRISSASTSGNQLTNNYIGLGSMGNTALPNLRGGVRIEDNASNNTVGIGNVISGNNGYGVSVGLTLPTATEVV